MAIIPMTKGGGDTDRVTFDPGVYVFTLESILIRLGKAYESDETYPEASFRWKDGDGDTFNQSFVKVPKGLKLNEKAKWTGILGALVGRPLTDEDAFGIDLGDDISGYDDLDAAVREKTDNGGTRTVKVLALEVDGQSLFGRSAQLNLAINDKGYNACKGVTPLPSAGGKKKGAAPTPPSAPTVNRTKGGGSPTPEQYEQFDAHGNALEESPY